MPLATRQFDFLRRLLQQESAIVLDGGKEYLVEARLSPIAESLGLPDVAALLDKLQTAPTADTRRSVVEAMTTNETSFFRDGHPFDALRTNIFPDLLVARAAQARLEIWCAACSTGQEPYSLAILLHELVPDLARWRVRILATDLAERMVTRAREGLYSAAEIGRGMPDHLLQKYFQRDGNRWRVGRQLRSVVEFRQCNLSAPLPQLHAMDLIMLRNVLIYFDVATKRRILEATGRVLAPDGYLCLGTAETTLGICDRYQRVTFGKAVFYRWK